MYFQNGRNKRRHETWEKNASVETPSFILENVTILPSLLKFWFSSNSTNKMSELLNKNNQKRKYLWENLCTRTSDTQNKSIKAKNFGVMWLIFVYLFPRNLKQQLLDLVWHFGFYDNPVPQRVIQKKNFHLRVPSPPVSEYKAIVNVRVMLGLGLG